MFELTSMQKIYYKAEVLVTTGGQLFLLSIWLVRGLEGMHRCATANIFEKVHTFFLIGCKQIETMNIICW